MKFDLLLCDVPWSYRDKSCAGERGAVFKYPVLTLKDLAALALEPAEPEVATP
jgi:hypothetical protein